MKILEIIDSISSVSRKTLISSWNKSRGLRPTKKPSDVDEVENELIKLKLLDLDEFDDQTIEVSDHENEPLDRKNK